MLVAACVCPHPPLVVPAVAAGSDGETAQLRLTCVQAVRRLAESGADRVVAVGPATRPGSGRPGAGERQAQESGPQSPGGAHSARWDEAAGGSLRRFGVDISFGGAADVLPLSLTVGAFLLDEVGWTGRREYVAVEHSAPPRACAELGSSIALSGEPSALLVLGDGSAKRTTAAPGHLDARAAEFDAAVAAALAQPDPEALLALSPALADDLWVAGRAAWQVLAGALRATYRSQPGTSLVGAVRYDNAPFGVGYFTVDVMVNRVGETPPGS